MITKRKSALSTVSSDSHHAAEATETNGSSGEGNISAGTSGVHVPRLEIINNFDDYADFQPESMARQGDRPRSEKKKKKAKNRKQYVNQPESVSWEDDYDPTRPIDLDEYLNSDERRQARTSWNMEKNHLGLVKASRVPSNFIPPSVAGSEQETNFRGKAKQLYSTFYHADFL